MSILPMSISVPISPRSLSSVETLSGGWTLTTKLSQLSLTAPGSIPFKSSQIRMGGGARTYPGGVSRRQWQRMQANKAKKLLKAGLARERQIYAMRRRAELKAAVSELERPWETVEKAPKLFSVSADEQLKVLADRVQKPGGLNLWSEKDGPELFRPDNGLPSARFFPKGVVHRVKPYGKIEKMSTASDELDCPGTEEDSDPVPNTGNLQTKGYYKNSRSSYSGPGKGRNVSGSGPRSSEGVAKDLESKKFKGTFGKRQSRRTYLSDSDGMNSNDTRFHGRNNRRNNRLGCNAGEFRMRQSRRSYLIDSDRMNSNNTRFQGRNYRRNNRLGSNAGEFRRSKSSERGHDMDSEVFDMSLQNDGSYGFELEN